MRNQFQISALFILIVFIVLASCSSPETKDDSYLTPIPESTLSAFQENRSYPIKNKFDAVLVARYFIAQQSDSFVLSQDDLRVRSVEKTNLIDVYKFLGYKTDTVEDTQVWFVAFDGSWQTISLAGDISPTKTGCMYVYLNVKDPMQKGLNSSRGCIQQ